MHIGEVIRTDKAYEPDQKDESGNILPLGSVKVRLHPRRVDADPIDIWARPAWHTQVSPPLRGEYVAVFEGPGYHESTPATMTPAYFFLPTSINVGDDLSFNQIPNHAHRSNKGKKGKAFLPGKMIPFPPRPQPVSQIFEGETIIRGRMGNTIRLSMSLKANGTSQKPTWKLTGQIGDPITIIKNSIPGKNKLPPHFRNIGVVAPNLMQKLSKTFSQTYDIENLAHDASSLYITTTQRLPYLIPARSCTIDTKTLGLFGNPQLINDADRIVMNAKKDKLFLLGKKKVHISAHKIHFVSDKYNVDFDDMMDVLTGVTKQLKNLTSATAVFATAAGPTGPATNIVQCLLLYLKTIPWKIPCISIPVIKLPAFKKFVLGEDSIQLKSANNAVPTPPGGPSNSNPGGGGPPGGGAGNTGAGSNGSAGGAGGGSSSSGGSSSGGGGGSSSSSGGGSGGGSSSSSTSISNQNSQVQQAFSSSIANNDSIIGENFELLNTYTYTTSSFTSFPITGSIITDIPIKNTVTLIQNSIECKALVYRLEVEIINTHLDEVTPSIQDKIYLGLVYNIGCNKGWYYLGSEHLDGVTPDTIKYNPYNKLNDDVLSDDECIKKDVEIMAYSDNYKFLRYTLINTKKTISV